jgi:hypothetical protein
MVIIFLEYDFIVIYKPMHTHLVADILFRFAHNK